MKKGSKVEETTEKLKKIPKFIDRRYRQIIEIEVA